MEIPEPEAEKDIRDLIPHILAVLAGTYGTLLRDQFVFLLKDPDLPSEAFISKTALNLREGHLSGRYPRENGKICPVVFPHLLNEDFLSLVQELRSRSSHVIHHGVQT